MGRLAKWIAILVVFVLAVIIVDVAALWVLTNTNWGQERVRTAAVNGLERIVHGRASIARVSGGMLSNITLEHVVITDSAGAPFVSVDSLTTSYSMSDLFRKRILLDHAVFVRPNVVLDRATNGVWNWQRVLPWLVDTSKVRKPPPTQAEWGQWVSITDGRIVDGRLLIRGPWAPPPNLSHAAADSAIRDALSGKARVFVERGPSGLRRRIEIDSITGKVPLLRISQPGQPSSVLQVDPLSMNAYFLRPPAGRFRDIRGAFAFSGDSIWWANASTSFPRGTRASGSGSFVFASGDMTLTLHGDPVVFDDVRWAYMPLPPDARGKMDFALRWRGLVQDYAVSKADITLRQARALGSFGITLDDSITIHNTDLRFTGVDTRLLSDIIPGLKLPRSGVFAGRATVRGGRRSMNVKGDISFDDRAAGVSRVIAEGQIGVLNGNVIRARDLRVQMLPLRVSMLRTWRPNLPVGGTVTGTTTWNGTTATQLALTMDVTHVDLDTSSIAGSTTLHMTGPTQVDLDVIAYPVSLLEVGRFFPSAGLRGSATGPIHAHGLLSNLKIDADLRLPDSGRVVAKGTFDVADSAKGYDVAATLASLNLHKILDKGPVTSLTGKVSGAGRGTDPATLSSKVAADFSTSRLVTAGADSIALDTLTIRASAANGDAHLEKFFAGGAQTRATASGSFGLDRRHIDSLTYAIVVDSLGALNRWFPRSADTTGVTARPAVTRRIMANARADSARIAKRTEMERLLHHLPAPKLVVVKPRPVPRDTMLGRLFVVGTLSGNLEKFDLRGRGEGDSIVARGNTVQHVVSSYALQAGRSTPTVAAVAAAAENVSAMGFGFDTAVAKATYAAPGPEDDGARGHVELSVVQRDTADRRLYQAKGDYALHPTRRVVNIAELSLQFDSTLWAMPRPDTIQWGRAGLRVANFELQNQNGPGRIRLRGELGTGIPETQLAIDVDSLPVADVVDLLQSDIDANGEFSFHGAIRGTTSDPNFVGRFELVDAELKGAPFPDLHGRATYADQRLVAHADVLHGNAEPMMTADARLPLNLAFTGVTGDRVLVNEPLSIDVAGDSLPIDLIPDITDLVSDVHGHAAAKFAVRGTFGHPALSGLATVEHATTTIVYTGATIEDIAGRIHMSGDSIYVDSLAGSAGGPVTLAGSLNFASWREPAFNLRLTSDAARLVNNDAADLRVDADLTLKGPFKRATAGGTLTIARGVIRAPEGNQRTLVGPGDPGLFNVVDTTSEIAQRLFPKPSPLIENLSVDLAVRVNPNTWVRNREANIEIYTSEPLAVRDSSQALTIRGVIYTDRGDYTLLTKRFQIRRGSATFIGGTELNPALQITGEYQVNVATRGAINIQVVVGGTLENPNVSLESDAQPPRSQSDLLTLIAFGQSTSSLIATSGSSVVATGAADVVGSGTQFVTWRLATIATGVLAEQAEFQAGRSLRADVFRITPADTPIEAGSGGLPGFFTRTRIEAGKYVTPRTFVSVQEQVGQFGAGIERRTQDGWRITGTYQPQVVLLEPTLNSQPYRALRSVGASVIRDWRF